MADPTIEELERLEAAASEGPWRAGRADTLSYDGDGYGPYKNVYGTAGHPHPKFPAEWIPDTVARGEGDNCIADAQLIAAIRNAAPSLIAAARRVAELERENAELREALQPFDVGEFRCDITVHCAQCGTPFRFLGLPLGFRVASPTTSVDGLELSAPIAPGPAAIPASGSITYEVPQVPKVKQ